MAQQDNIQAALVVEDEDIPSLMVDLFKLVNELVQVRLACHMLNRQLLQGTPGVDERMENKPAGRRMAPASVRRTAQCQTPTTHLPACPSRIKNP